MWQFLIIIIIIIGALFKYKQSHQWIENAYIYGYPLVLMYTTCQHMLFQNKTPINEFYPAPVLLTPEFQEVVSPNVDTLYLTAWLDLSMGPIILHVPNTNERYYLIEMLDAWTNVFANPGSRTTGNKEQNFLICGPQYHSIKYPIDTIYAPTNLVWILGRILCNGPNDYPIVNQLQNQFTLRVIKDKYQPKVSNIKANNDNRSPPQQVATMSTSQFFNQLLIYLKHNITSPMDNKIKEEVMSICHDLNIKNNAYDLAIHNAKNKIWKHAEIMGIKINGWKFVNGGQYGSDYLTRASVAMDVLGANLSSDAIYLYANQDINNNKLNGDMNYYIHFPPNSLPPVNAFWSITLYDDKHLLVPNKIHKYAIQSWQKLKYNPDQSLTITISADPKHNNWLPAPKSQYFNLILRMYWPRHNVFKGHWKPPAIIIK